MGKGWEALGAIAAAVVGLAIVSVLVSKNAQTPRVVQAATGGFSQIIGAAVAPVSGAAAGIGVGGVNQLLPTIPGLGGL